MSPMYPSDRMESRKDESIQGARIEVKRHRLHREAHAAPSMNFLMFMVSWMFVGVVSCIVVIWYTQHWSTLTPFPLP